MKTAISSLCTFGCIFGICICTLGCAGVAGRTVQFEELRYPASLSGYVYDHNNQKKSVNELEKVGDIKIKKRFWGFLWGLAPLSAKIDPSEIINEEIEKAGGEALVNMEVEVDECGANRIPILPLIPVFPGCAKVYITGQIVKTPKNSHSSQPSIDHVSKQQLPGSDVYLAKTSQESSIALDGVCENKGSYLFDSIDDNVIKTRAREVGANVIQIMFTTKHVSVTEINYSRTRRESSTGTFRFWSCPVTPQSPERAEATVGAMAKDEGSADTEVDSAQQAKAEIAPSPAGNSSGPADNDSADKAPADSNSDASSADSSST